MPVKRLLTIVLPVLALGFASNAEAAADPSVAASVMGVSLAQASEDLAVQHDAFQTIGKLIEAGDHIYFDNHTATIHIFGSATSVPIPSLVASHAVYDATLRSFPGSSKVMTSASCGTSNSTQEYCSPMEAGVRIEHQSGSLVGDCTAGFMVRDYSGNPYMVTAGHCAIWGTTFYTNPFSSETWPGMTTCQPGPWVGGDAPWSGYDAAITPITGCGGVIPYYHNWLSGADAHMTGATNTQYVGEYVCHFGVTSLYACGTIYAVNVPTTINYGESGSGQWTIQQTDQVCGYGAPGDSGGPVTDGTYPGAATGILLGAGTNYTTCPQGNGAVFIEQRIFTVLGLFNVYVASS